MLSREPITETNVHLPALHEAAVLVDILHSQFYLLSLITQPQPKYITPIHIDHNNYPHFIHLLYCRHILPFILHGMPIIKHSRSPAQRVPHLPTQKPTQEHSPSNTHSALHTGNSQANRISYCSKQRSSLNLDPFQ